MQVTTGNGESPEGMVLPAVALTSAPLARARRASGRRIVLVIDRLAGRGGGAERVLTETANALALRGHLVEIITHEHSRGDPFYPLLPGVMLTRLRPPPARSGGRPSTVCAARSSVMAIICRDWRIWPGPAVMVGSGVGWHVIWKPRGPMRWPQ